MAYTGMSYVELYKNNALTDVVPKNVNGDYIYELDVISNNARSPYTFNVYARNIGDHKAYGVQISVTQGSATTTTTPLDLVPNQYTKIPISINIAQGAITQEYVELKVVYDSI